MEWRIARADVRDFWGRLSRLRRFEKRPKPGGFTNSPYRRCREMLGFGKQFGKACPTRKEPVQRPNSCGKDLRADLR